MKRILLSMALAFGVAQSNAQLTADDIIYYLGSGPDTAFCVIDFQDGTADSSYAWGFLFDASSTTTGEDLLLAIEADEPKIAFDLAGGFLNEITYNTHVGTGGAPDYWGTWSRTSSTSWVSNSGIGEVLENGDWFGCSYTDFAPAIEPGEQYPAYDSKQWGTDDIQFWVGTGNDTAILVIDFVTPVFSEAVTYSWGFLFDGTTDGATMLSAIDDADVNLDIDASGFLNDIFFNDKSGEAGSPYYWGTFSGTNLTDWTLNGGLATTISNGDWFGCSYADWEPRRPFYPIAAIDSADFTMEDVLVWYGTGADSAVIVVDFNESMPGESFAFGYLFDGVVYGEDALNTIAAEDPFFSVNISSSFLLDVYYQTFEGVSATPNYWATWSATNAGGWETNIGLGTLINNGDWFGCSYTDFSPNNPPSLPEAALNTIGITENEVEIFIYPNPSTGIFHLSSTQNILNVEVFGMDGKKIESVDQLSDFSVIDLRNLQRGAYILSVTTENGVTQKSIVLQ